MFQRAQPALVILGNIAERSVDVRFRSDVIGKNLRLNSDVARDLRLEVVDLSDGQPLLWTPVFRSARTSVSDPHAIQRTVVLVAPTNAMRSRATMRPLSLWFEPFP